MCILFQKSYQEVGRTYSLKPTTVEEEFQNRKRYFSLST